MAGQQGGGGGQTPNDQAMNLLWFIVLIIGLLLLLWWQKRSVIVTPVFMFRIAELYVLSGIGWLWNLMAVGLPFLHVPTINTAELANLRDYMQSTPIASVDYVTFAAVNNQIGLWLRIPSLIILVTLASIVFFRHASNLFNKIYDMNKLKVIEVNNWPQITPVLTIDLLKEDLDKGPWAMAQLPLDFCKQHGLLSVAEENGMPVWKILSGKAYPVLVLQLGSMWRGVKHLPIYMKALVVICIARAIREKEVADQLLTQISRSAASGKLNFAGVEEQLAKYKKQPVLLWAEKRHAYVTGVLSTLLEMARANGVLASAEFLWLKPVDRRLWFTLNSVGRNTAFVEVAGAFAHWIAEKKLKRRMKTPLVTEAVTALESAVRDILYIHDNDNWQTFQSTPDLAA